MRLTTIRLIRPLVVLAAALAMMAGVTIAPASAQDPVPVTAKVNLLPMYWSDQAPATDPRSAFPDALAATDAYYNTISAGNRRITPGFVRPWTRIRLSAQEVATCDTAAIAREMVRAWPQGQILEGSTIFMLAGNPNCDFEVLTAFPWQEDETDVLINSVTPPTERVLIPALMVRYVGDGTQRLECTDAQGDPVPLSRDCRASDFIDPWSPFRPAQDRQRLGIPYNASTPFGYPHPRELRSNWNFGAGPLLDDDYWRAVPTDQGPQTVEINRVQPDASVVQAARFVLGEHLYELEYRAPVGLDAWIDDESYVGSDGVRRTTPGGGVILTRTLNDEGFVEDGPAELVYFHPPVPGAEHSKRHPGLDVGESYTAPDGLVKIEVLAGDLTKARVRVSFPAFDAVQRWWGQDRYDASAAISKEQFPAGTATAYVASGEIFTDALTGAPAAAMHGAPVLLTAKSTLPGPVAAELARLRPESVVVLGGENTIATSVLDRIRTVTGAAVTRIADTDRFATSARISRLTYPGQVGTVYVASGRIYTDALSGAAIPGRQSNPLLLVDTDEIPPAIATELRRLSPERIVIFGGPATVSAGVEAGLGAYATKVVRLSGADRFATSAAISRWDKPNGGELVFVASGRVFADALSGAPVAGLTGATTLLVDTDEVPDAVAAELRRLRPRAIVVLGGPRTVTDEVRAELSGYLR